MDSNTASQDGVLTIEKLTVAIQHLRRGINALINMLAEVEAKEEYLAELKLDLRLRETILGECTESLRSLSRPPPPSVAMVLRQFGTAMTRTPKSLAVYVKTLLARDGSKVGKFLISSKAVEEMKAEFSPRMDALKESVTTYQSIVTMALMREILEGKDTQSTNWTKEQWFGYYVGTKGNEDSAEVKGETGDGSEKTDV